MKICPKCGASFRTLVKIDGKPHNLHNRIYCLECSPYGSKNTKKIHLDDVELHKNRDLLVDRSPTKPCIFCKKPFRYIRNDGKGVKQCSTCTSRIKRYTVKLKMIRYKGGKCEKCGYDKCIDALVFHHLDPSQKKLTLSLSYCRKWEDLKTELDKCVMLCANCHTEEHYLREDIEAMLTKNDVD
jgi:hypothetical protein